MNVIVIYKSKYGSTKVYAEWIAEELGCEAKDAKYVKAEDFDKYDTIIYGGGLYAEIISGVTLVTKNMQKLRNKKVVVFTTGLTPIDCREYYEKYVIEKNFKTEEEKKIKVFNFLGKMIVDELTFAHKAAIKTLKRIMSKKENPSDMERMLIDLCESDGDFTDKNAILPLIDYVRN